MADWYVSSAAYAGYTAFQISHAYTVGDLIVPTAPTNKGKYVLRCTVAGTSAGTEPTWPTANNGTVVSGGATFANVSGQSTYGWSAAAGDIPTLIGGLGQAIRFVAGDRMFVSSDHTETQTISTTYGAISPVSFTSGQVLSVNRAGSVPPVAADLQAGATVTVTGSTQTMNIDCVHPIYVYGISFIYTGGFVGVILFGVNGTKAAYFDTCQFWINTTSSVQRIQFNSSTLNITFYNTTLRFGHVGQIFNISNASDLVWLNTPSAIVGPTIPTTLFGQITNNFQGSVTMRGVDLSALTTTLASASNNVWTKMLLDGCRIAPGLTRLGAFGNTTRDEVELFNCYDGTHIVNERYQIAGAVTTEFTITLTGGATDNVGTFSHKMVSTANVDKYANTLNGFWMDMNYTVTGSLQTATVEIISSLTLNNDDVWFELEYLGTSGSSLATFVDSLPATILTTATAIPTSTVAWNSSPATPVKQHLQVTFTPQQPGRVRGRVRLGRASTTVYYDPRIVIT